MQPKSPHGHADIDVSLVGHIVVGDARLVRHDHALAECQKLLRGARE